MIVPSSKRWVGPLELIGSVLGGVRLPNAVGGGGDDGAVDAIALAAAGSICVPAAGTRVVARTTASATSSRFGGLADAGSRVAPVEPRALSRSPSGCWAAGRRLS